ncbi:MAG: CDP-diacylglycerol--glycerol-3-phosphate 3-phosphatidyltransferase [Actinomycetota bacterium]
MTDSRRVARPGDSPVSPWNVANLITMTRILFAPFFVWLIVIDPAGQLRWVALVLFSAGTALDGVDGHLARSRNLGTPLGVLLDPIADKVLIGAGLIVLSAINELPWWVTIVILLREVGITVYRMAIVHREVHGASWLGKTKTFVQSFAVAFAIAPFAPLVGGWIDWWNTFLMASAFVLTVWSGIEYLWKAVRP